MPRVRAWRAALRVMLIGLAFEHVPAAWRKDFNQWCGVIARERDCRSRDEWRALVAEARRHYALENEELRRIHEECRKVKR